MYTEPFFREERVDVLHEVMQSIGLVSLISMGREGLDASHVPVVVNMEEGDKGTIHGHLFRGNDQWKKADVHIPVLVIFSGPETYVSPSWYESKKKTPNVVPTWNYVAIHAYGKINFYDDRDRLLSMIAKLTDRHEQGRSTPWSVTDAKEEYIEKLLKGVIGFEIPIERLDGKFKLSQNKNEADRLGVVQGLQADGVSSALDVAEMMLETTRS